MSAATTDSFEGTRGVVDEYSHDVPLGGRNADAVFSMLEQRLLHYRIFPPDIMRADVCSEDGRIREGTTIVQHVAVGPIWLEAAVRVVRVTRTRDTDVEETAFTYATVEGHPERGVSTFRIRRSRDSDLITFQIDVRSEPGTLLLRLARPLARNFQRKATNAALMHFTRDAGTRTSDDPAAG